MNEIENINPVIFIVEDCPIQREAIIWYLESRTDYQFMAFSTGEQMLKYTHLNPDIIVLDHHLSSGKELRMNAHDIIAQLPEDQNVIILSGQNDLMTSIRLIKSGIKDYILKDQNKEKNLLLSIENLLAVDRIRETTQDLSNRIMIDFLRLGSFGIGLTIIWLGLL